VQQNESVNRTQSSHNTMQQTKQIYQNSNALDRIESNATAEAI